MAVFWWLGKGYFTILIVLAVFSAFGAMIPIGAPYLKETPLYWSIACIVAAVFNWVAGRKVNAKAIASIRSAPFRRKLIYRARHRFMSLPLELWSIPLNLGGIAIMAHHYAARV